MKSGDSAERRITPFYEKWDQENKDHHLTCMAMRLRMLRQSKGMSQDDLARELGVSRGSIGFYESCQRVPDILFISKAAAFFDVNVNYLAGGTYIQTPGNEEICERLHLLDIAIPILEKDQELGRDITLLIEEESGRKLLHFCYEYMTGLDERAEKTYASEKLFETKNDAEEYERFLLTKLFLSVLDALRKRWNLNKKQNAQEITEAYQEIKQNLSRCERVFESGDENP